MEDKERTIIAEIPGCQFDVDVNNGDLTPTLNKYSGGWLPSPTINNIITWEGSIDLSGYAMEDLTFIPYASFRQTGFYTAYIGGVGYQRYDCITSVPMTTNELVSTLVSSSAPGFIQFNDPTNQEVYSEIERTQVLHGEGYMYAKDTSYPGTDIMQERYSNTSSSLEPTAADKLYVYSFILVDRDNNPDPGDPGAQPPIPPGNNFGSALIVSPMRIIMPGMWTKEPELEYMMRLKRSYELANQE